LIDGDGCSSSCKIESGFIYLGEIPGYGTSIMAPICGDGIGVDEINDWCDEGSTPTGCSATCDSTIDPYSCTIAIKTAPSYCYICGNLIIEFPEQCDDGNSEDLDGCSKC